MLRRQYAYISSYLVSLLSIDNAFSLYNLNGKVLQGEHLRHRATRVLLLLLLLGLLFNIVVAL